MSIEPQQPVVHTPLEVGDVVRLNSGGPAMTVVAVRTVDPHNLCMCTWMLVDETVKFHEFASPCLKRVVEAPAPTPVRSTTKPAAPAARNGK